MPREQGCYLAFDYGMKRIGVAIGQTISCSATPLKTLAAKDGLPQWQLIDDLIQTWHPRGLIVGLPLMMDDTEQFISHAAKAFAKELELKFLLPVYLIDERLSSKEARSRLFERGGYKALQQGMVDQMAAALILEDWLRSG